MSKFSRRDFLKTTAGAAAAGTLGAGGAMWSQDAMAQAKWTPEKGAKLRVLRWKRFVQGDEDKWLENTKAFTKKTGIEVRVDSEGWEDVRPKAAVAANVGSGPDIIISTFEDAHQYPDKLVDVTDVCNYLGGKYGGWYDVCKDYCTEKGKWIAVPMGCAGNAVVHRISAMKKAGFEEFPKDLAGFLKLAQAYKAAGLPPGFALGNATGDGNVWTHWLVWAHGGKMVDQKGNVVIASPETEAALNYGKQLYETFIPGTLSWLDPNNNKAFLDGQIGMTANGISIYYAAKTSPDAKLKEMANDIGHANFPVGPVGKTTELNLFFPMMLFKYSKYPNAAKAYLAFMMEKEQYEPWQQAALGYVSHPLKAYEKNPLWTSDPKNGPYSNSMKVMLPNGYAGPMGYASAATMADFIMVNMVAEAVSGSKSPKEAMERAKSRAERYYKL
ncbi:MAG TPA: extracellular solute-binding protein [Usitatibacter sp.]|nr:extracellular solute-binding protein [Usitatibacter sp.]